MENQNILTVEARRAIEQAATEKRFADISEAKLLKEMGCSNVFISKRMGIKEASVRALLAQDQA